ncbi:MAG TPA: sulfotransferase [Sphingomicrobium sp.]
MTANPDIDARTADVIRAATDAARVGRIRQACEIGEAGLADGGDPAALHAMIGWLLIRAQQFESSISHLQQAHLRRPADPVILRNLAIALSSCERHADTLALLTSDLVAAKGDVELLKMRGFAAQASEDFDAAVESYERVVAANPDDWEIWNNLGNAKVGAGDLAGGVAALRRAAELNPNVAPTRLNLARALRQSGELGQAEAELRQMALNFRNDSVVHTELADLFSDAGNHEEAERALQAAIEREPRNSDLYVRLGRQQLMVLAGDRAERSFDQALALQPDNAEAFTALTFALEHYRPDGLSELMARARAISLGGHALALLEAVIAWRERRYEAGIEALRGIPEAFEPQWRWQLEAQLLNGLGRYDAAFAAFKRLNDTHAADPSDPIRRATELRHRLQDQLRTVTPQWRDGWRARPIPAPNAPAFLLGFPRSGTTLLDTMLMGNPQVRVMEERPVMLRVEAEIGGLEAMAQLDDEGVENARRRYFEIAAEYVERREGTLLVDKSPLHLQRLPQIVRLFPNAKIILALRHPADVVLSCFMSNFRLNSAMANFLRLDTAAEFYDLTFSMWEKASSLFPVEVHTVVYERLIEDPEATLKPVVEALGLSWHPEMLDHQRTAEARGPISTASYAQVVRPLYREASGRWRKYRQHLESVLPTLEPWIRKFGYDL